MGDARVRSVFKSALLSRHSGSDRTLAPVSHRSTLDDPFLAAVVGMQVVFVLSCGSCLRLSS